MEKGNGLLSVLGTLYTVKPYLAIISLQFGYAGMYIISLVSLKGGMSHFILVVYRHAVATLAIAPFALVLERTIRPKMTLRTFLKIMALGLLEPVIDQNLYYLGMQYTSAAFASASVNMLPAITFIMAVIFRIEQVQIKKVPFQAKVIGTILTVTGAMVMTVYKGPAVLGFLTRGGQQVGQHGSSSAAAAAEQQHWLLGTLMLLMGCCGWSGFFILQSFTLKEYPAQLSLTAWICFLGMIESGAVALVMEHHPTSWALGFNSRLLAAVYSGVVCSGLAYYVQGVVSKARGPVFVTAFSPLGMIITAVLGSVVLAEQVHLGSVIGAVIIVLGLYSVVWGKSKDLSAVTPPASEIDDEKWSDQEGLPTVDPAAKINPPQISA